MTFADTIFQWMLKLRRPDGSIVDGQSDAAGNLRVAVVADVRSPSVWVDPDRGTPLTYRHVSATLPGRILLRVMGSNEGTSDRWLMLFDTNKNPILGQEATFALPVPKGGTFDVSFTPDGRTFETGISWGVSTSASTYQEDVAAAFRVHLQIREPT